MLALDFEPENTTLFQSQMFAVICEYIRHKMNWGIGKDAPENNNSLRMCVLNDTPLGSLVPISLSIHFEDLERRKKGEPSIFGDDLSATSQEAVSIDADIAFYKKNTLNPVIVDPVWKKIDTQTKSDLIRAYGNIFENIVIPKFSKIRGQAEMKLFQLGEDGTQIKSPLYANYGKFEEKHEKAEKKLSNALSDGESNNELITLLRKSVERALTQWELEGSKIQVDGLLKQYQSEINNKSFWDEFNVHKSEFDLAQKHELVNTAITYPDTELLPQFPITEPGRWTTAALSTADIMAILDSTTCQIYNLNTDELPKKPNELKLTFEYFTCNIKRSWLNDTFLSARYWRLRNDVQLADEKGDGPLGKIAQSCIFVRNIQFEQKSAKLIVATEAGTKPIAVNTTHKILAKTGADPVLTMKYKKQAVDANRYRKFIANNNLEATAITTQKIKQLNGPKNVLINKKHLSMQQVMFAKSLSASDLSARKHTARVMATQSTRSVRTAVGTGKGNFVAMQAATLKPVKTVKNPPVVIPLPFIVATMLEFPLKPNKVHRKLKYTITILIGNFGDFDINDLTVVMQLIVNSKLETNVMDPMPVEGGFTFTFIYDTKARNTGSKAVLQSMAVVIYHRRVELMSLEKINLFSNNRTSITDKFKLEVSTHKQALAGLGLETMSEGFETEASDPSENFVFLVGYGYRSNKMIPNPDPSLDWQDIV